MTVRSQRPLKAIWLLLVFPAAMAGTLPAPAAEQRGVSRERPIKATFLYHFGQFVRWPEASFRSEEDAFVIGVLGTDPIGNLLDKIATTKRVKGHRIVVRRFATLKQYTACHIL